MTPWTVRYGLSLTVAFAATSATAVADVDGNLSCVRDATDGAMEQVNTAITTAKIYGRRPTRVSLK